MTVSSKVLESENLLFHLGPYAFQIGSLCGDNLFLPSLMGFLVCLFVCQNIKYRKLFRKHFRDFPGDPETRVHTPSAGGPRSIPDQGPRFHMWQLRPGAVK